MNSPLNGPPTLPGNTVINSSLSHDHIIRYLLGDLPPADRGRIEKEILRADDFYNEVEIAETELIDRYAYGRLGIRQQFLFVKNFLTSHRRKERLQCALALKKKFANEPLNAARPVLRYALVMTLMLTALLVTSNVVLVKQKKNDEIHIASLQKQIEKIQGTGPSLGNQDAIKVESFTAGEVFRGSKNGNIHAISLPNGIRAVQFALEVPIDKQLSHDLTLHLLNDGRNKILATIPDAHIQIIDGSAKVIATFPVEYLKRGNYFISIDSPEPNSFTLYLFRVK